MTEKKENFGGQAVTDKLLAKLGPLNPDFAFLLILLAWVNRRIGEFVPVPGTGTFASFQAFESFYRRAFFAWLAPEGCLPPADYANIAAMTPAMFFTCFLGKCFGIQNALPLFKASVVLEQLLLAAGTYLLARMLFRARAAVLAVTAGVLASALWFSEIDYNLRIFYLMPLAAYFLLRFDREKKGVFFWLSGLVFVFGQFGLPLPLSMFQLLPAVLGLGVLVSRKTPPRQAFRPKNPALLFAFAACLLAAWLCASSAIEGLRHLSRAVRPGGALPLAGFEKFLGFFCGDFRDLTAVLYSGILPAVFVLVALRAVRKPAFLVLAGLVFFFAVFSAGDRYLLSRIAGGIFPPVGSLANTGALAGLLRPGFLLMAGFGIDYFLNAFSSPHRPVALKCRRELAWCAAFVFAVMTIIAFSKLNGRLFETDRPNAYFFTQFLSLLAASLLVLRKMRPQSAAALIVLFFFLDIFSYQNAFVSAWSLSSQSFPTTGPGISGFGTYTGICGAGKAALGAIVPAGIFFCAAGLGVFFGILRRRPAGSSACETQNAPQRGRMP